MPNVGPKTIAVGIDLSQAIPDAVHTVELLHHGEPGPAKRRAVIAFLVRLFTIAGRAAAANNPRFAPAIGGMVDATVAAMNASGSMPKP